MLPCLDDNLALAYLEHTLSTDEYRRVEQHLDACPTCRRLVSDAARGLSAPMDDPALLSTDAGAFRPRGTDPSALARGAQLGRYVILDRLGQGGMGVVYSAYDPQLDRKVAIKLLRAAADTSPERQERLAREAQAMARLSHPNIVAVHDVGSIAGQIFITMEFIEGMTLRKWLAEQKRPWRELLGVFVQAGRALAAAHAAGIVHRDFKPDNVIMSRDGRVRVLDFGLAQAASAKDPGASSPAERVADPAIAGVDGSGKLATPLTETGSLVGTPAYMAPEQLLGHATEARTDQFGFCVAFYEALYGERPFSASSLAALRLAVSQGLVKAAPADSAVPTWLREILLRGLAVRIEDRFPSMEALLAALPGDPDAESSFSDRARALATGGLGAAAVALIIYRRFILRVPVDLDPSNLSFRTFTLWVLVVTLIAAVSLLTIGRKTILGSRISRHITAAFAIIFYTVALQYFAAHRLGISVGAITILNSVWAGAFLIFLGIALRREFLWLGLLSLVTALISLARPAYTIALSELNMALILLLLTILWSRPRRG